MKPTPSWLDNFDQMKDCSNNAANILKISQYNNNNLDDVDENEMLSQEESGESDQEVETLSLKFQEESNERDNEHELSSGIGSIDSSKNSQGENLYMLNLYSPSELRPTDDVDSISAAGQIKQPNGCSLSGQQKPLDDTFTSVQNFLILNE